MTKTVDELIRLAWLLGDALAMKRRPGALFAIDPTRAPAARLRSALEDVVPAWRPIDTAPKDRVVLLWFPEIYGWAAGPWRGCWSWTGECWAIHTPIKLGERMVVATGLPPPTHWAPLPEAPE